MFEYFDDYSFFLVGITRSDLSQSTTTKAPLSPPVSREEQNDGSTAFQSLDIPSPNDPSITSCTDYLFLASLVDVQGMDWHQDNFSFNYHLE